MADAQRFVISAGFMFSASLIQAYFFKILMAFYFNVSLIVMSGIKISVDASPGLISERIVI